MLKLDKKFISRIFIIALPIIIQQFIMALAQLVDNLMVGSLGEAAIAGVGASNMIFSIVLFLSFGISEGCSIFSAQQYGARQIDKLRHTFVVCLYLSLILAISSMLIVGFNNEFLISLFINGDNQTAINGLTYGVNYTKVAIFSYIFITINVAIGTLFRSTGNTRVPMIAGVAAILTNTFLNYVFIFGNFGFPEMGVMGAGLATVLSRILELSLLLYFMYREHVDFVPKVIDFKTVPVEQFKEITLKVIPLSINEFGWSFGRATIMALYGARSAEEFAAVQISNTVANLLFVAMSGFSVAVSVVIGQELGRGNLNQAKEDSKKLLVLGLYVGIFISFIAYVLVFILPYFYNSVSDSTMLLAQQFLFLLILT